MIRKKEKGQLIVLSGPSGVGKSTVIAELLGQRRDIYFSVSYTTRQPRVGEQNGVNYNFVSREEFEGMIQRDELLEYAEYVSNYYGTSLKAIQEKLDAGIDVLLDIEVQGAAKVRSRCPDALFIFIIPPSFEELSRRLHGRHTDSEEVIQGRWRRPARRPRKFPSTTIWLSTTRYPTRSRRSSPSSLPHSAAWRTGNLFMKEFLRYDALSCYERPA